MRCLPLLVGLITLAMGVRMPTGGGREEGEERVKGGLNFGVEGGWRFGVLSFVRGEIANVGCCWSGVSYRKGKKSLIVIDQIGGWGLRIGGWR